MIVNNVNDKKKEKCHFLVAEKVEFHQFHSFIQSENVCKEKTSRYNKKTKTYCVLFLYRKKLSHTHTIDCQCLIFMFVNRYIYIVLIAFNLNLRKIPN